MASTVSAQDAASIGGQSNKRFFVGGGFGMSTGSVDSFEKPDPRAPGETHFSIHTGARLRRSLYIEGILTGRVELAGDKTEVLLTPNRPVGNRGGVMAM